MAELLTSSPDFVTIATNVGVFLVAAGTVITAIWSAAKKIKAAMPADTPQSKVVGGMIVDHTSMLMWSESNRLVVDALRDHQKEMMELRFVMSQVRDKL